MAKKITSPDSGIYVVAFVIPAANREKKFNSQFASLCKDAKNNFGINRIDGDVLFAPLLGIKSLSSHEVVCLQSFLKKWAVTQKISTTTIRGIELDTQNTICFGLQDSFHDAAKEIMHKFYEECEQQEMDASEPLLKLQVPLFKKAPNTPDKIYDDLLNYALNADLTSVIRIDTVSILQLVDNKWEEYEKFPFSLGK